jgi:hypothetical protein
MNCTGEQRHVRIIGLRVVIIPSAIATNHDALHRQIPALD